MSKIGVGIIGTGGIAQGQHMPAYARLSDQVQIVAVADINEESARAAAEKFNVPHVYTDFREMLKRDDIHAVSVTTPNFLHKDATIAALEAGKHVLCEKPLARNAHEAREMVQAARRANRILQVALQWRFTGIGQFLHKYIREEGNLGDIYYARAHALRRRGIPGWGVFIDKEKQGGGPLIDIGVHILDATLWLMGYPKPVTAFGATYTKFGNRPDVVGLMGQWDHTRFTVEDFAVGLIRFDNGATVTLESSFCANIGEDEFNTLLLGDKGGVFANPFGTPAVRIFTESNRTLYNIEPANIPNINSYHLEVERFVDAIIHNKPSPVPGEHGFYLNAIMDAIYESSETGREVQIDTSL
ncbi:MAG: Gfo/Idh/MocA family oxidoreductase [Fimbriimonadales bacterium]